VKVELPVSVRFVNVVDLFTLQSHRDHPHGLDDDQFESGPRRKHGQPGERKVSTLVRCDSYRRQVALA
jgi:hypothetical protein